MPWSLTWVMAMYWPVAKEIGFKICQYLALVAMLFSKRDSSDQF